MSDIRVTELFYSIQGEGRYVGVPSLFLRTYGCNFQCRGFGMPKGEKTTQPDEIAYMVFTSPEKYKTQESLPLATKGCDTYLSWHPAFKDYSNWMTIDEIVANIKSKLPGGKFSKDVHLVITGGEPLLGWQREYPKLLNILEEKLNLTNVTFETNGTQKLTDTFVNFMKTSGILFHFSVSAKLSASGEKWEDAIKPDVVDTYNVANAYIDFKFVVDSMDGIREVNLALNEYKHVTYDSVYIMPEGGTNEEYSKNMRNVAQYAMEKGFRYSPRLQNDLFKNEWAT